MKVQVDEAIILAAGQGLRLRPLTEDTPKCLIPVGGKSMLRHQVEWLVKNKISKIIVTFNQKVGGRKMISYVKELQKRCPRVEFVVSEEEQGLGTAGGVKKAISNIEREEFFVINADDLTDVNLDNLRRIGSNCITVGHQVSDWGVVRLRGNRVVEFVEKPLLPYWINIGIYLLGKEVESLLPNKGSLEKDVFSSLKDLKAYRYRGRWVTINTVKDLQEAEWSVGV